MIDFISEIFFCNPLQFPSLTGAGVMGSIPELGIPSMRAPQVSIPVIQFLILFVGWIMSVFVIPASNGVRNAACSCSEVAEYAI